MKTESFFYLGVTAFFVVIGTIYWFWSYEDAGATMLAAASLLGLVAAGTWTQYSRVRRRSHLRRSHCGGRLRVHHPSRGFLESTTHYQEEFHSPRLSGTGDHHDCVARRSIGVPLQRNR